VDKRGDMSTLAGAFELLGFPRPYIQAKSYADVVELVRLEHGVVAIDGTEQVATLAHAFGVCGTLVDIHGAMPSLKSGKAVVAWHNGHLIGLVGQNGAQLCIEDGGGRRDILSADLSAASWLALQLPADVDAGLVDRKRVAKDGKDVIDAYKTSVYAVSNQDEQDWYVKESNTVHGAQSKDIKDWIPDGTQAAAIPDAAQHKALRAWLGRNGKRSIKALIKTKTHFVDPLKTAGGGRAGVAQTQLQVLAHKILDGHMHHAPGDSAHTQALSAIALASQSGLVDAALSQKYSKWADELIPVPSGPTADDFKELFAKNTANTVSPRPAGDVANVTVSGSVALTDGSGNSTNGKGKGTDSRKVNGSWGNVKNTIETSTWGKVRGWATPSNQTEVDGNRLTT
jgi:hypothetical protein